MKFGYNELTKQPGYGVTKLSDAKIKRFQSQWFDIANAFGSVGWKPEPGEIFNSGYEGFTFRINGCKVVVIEQPGKVGLEDHSVGYLSIMLGDKEVKIIEHRDKRFGDVNLNEAELERGYGAIVELIEGYLEQFYDPYTKQSYGIVN